MIEKNNQSNGLLHYNGNNYVVNIGTKYFQKMIISADYRTNNWREYIRERLPHWAGESPLPGVAAAPTAQYGHMGTSRYLPRISPSRCENVDTDQNTLQNCFREPANTWYKNILKTVSWYINMINQSDVSICFWLLAYTLKAKVVSKPFPSAQLSYLKMFIFLHISGDNNNT